MGEPKTSLPSPGTVVSTATPATVIIDRSRGWVVREIRSTDDARHVEVTFRRARPANVAGHYDTLRIMVPYEDAPPIGHQARLDLFRDEG